MGSNDERSEIAFFDVETTAPTRDGQRRAILEFGAILVCPRKLEELDYYSSLVRPADSSLISFISDRKNGITQDAVRSAPSFAEISDAVYDLLHGRIWAGHNIVSFDWERIREAFSEINRPPPEPKGIIDSLTLLTQRFGRRAGNMKLDTLATYFGLGRQMHRTLDDLRINLRVLMYCATVLFLESSLQVELDTTRSDSFHMGSLVGQINTESLQRDISKEENPEDFTLQLGSRLRVRFGIHKKYFDHAGRQRLSFVVDVDQSLCRVLDACNGVAQKMSLDSGSTSEWKPVVTRKFGFNITPTARLHIPTVVIEDVAHYATEIYQKQPSGAEQKLVFSKFNPAELAKYFKPGTFVDAYFSLDPYDYQQNAGIRLVAKKLIILPE